MNEEAFQIKTEVFEGPLDLLLSLIEKRKLFINDISLSQVADDYIEHVKTLEQFPMEMTAHFILIASTLLLIKSKSLLPTLELTSEEEGSIEDLENRLKMYQRVKEVSRHVKERFGENIIFPKSEKRETVIVFSPHESMTTLSMLESMKRILESLPKPEVLPKAVVKKVISLEEMINRLTDRVKSDLKMSFSQFAEGQGKTKAQGSKHTTTREEKVNIIVSFLAMLELVKQGIIAVNQENFDHDITIETQGVEVPNYH